MRRYGALKYVQCWQIAMAMNDKTMKISYNISCKCYDSYLRHHSQVIVWDIHVSRLDSGENSWKIKGTQRATTSQIWLVKLQELPY